MKRVNITTLTIGLISLVILLIATMIAQCMSGKEGFAGGGIPAKFFSGLGVQKGGPNYRFDADLKTENGQPMFDVPIAKPLEGETNEEYYKRLGTLKSSEVMVLQHLKKTRGMIWALNRVEQNILIWEILVQITPY